MFIDEAVIHFIAGDGGNGCHAHERQPYCPNGRPDGGDGGRGGHIFLMGSAQMHTLQDMAYRQTFKTDRGMHGKGSHKKGKSAEDLILEVPLGTMIYDNETNELIVDCIENGKKILIAEGGRGGRGNASLACRMNPNPESAEKGKPGEDKTLRLVLKVLADVGLVGRPNAGKSTLLSRISHARPKIADYPFTTTEPHLGIVPTGKGHTFMVVADIPGLIEDSHKGKGLGIRFLRHIERTRVLTILIEATAEDPQKEADILLNELAQYSESLANKPKLFILSKNDLIPDDMPVVVPEGWLTISAVSGKGIDQAVRKLADIVIRARDNEV
jgi:GTP-binding protein